MVYTSLRKLIRGVLDESSRHRRAAVRDTLQQAYGSDPEGAPPTLSSGRVNKLAQMAQLGYELAGETAGSPPKYGFTMTSIQKVGINPASTFETPLALYAYPVEPRLVDQLLGGKFRDVGRQIPEIAATIPAGEGRTSLPFVATAPYINFFRINDTPGVYYTSVGMDDSSYRNAVDNLYMWFADRSGVPDTDKTFRRSLVRAQQHNNINRGSTIKLSAALDDYGRLATIWTLSRALSLLKTEADFVKYHAAAEGDEPPPIGQSNISMWRTLLLMAGVKAVVDDAGKGLIHRLEPTQIAVMDTTILEVVQQFDNVTPAATTGRDPAGRKQQERTRYTTKFVDYVRQDLAEENPNFVDVLHNVDILSTYPSESKRQLKDAGLFDDLQEFVRNFIKNSDINAVLNEMGSFYSAYKIFGDVIITDILDRIAASSTPYSDFGTMIEKRQTYSLSFALMLFKSFAAKYRSEIAEERQFYVNLIVDLADAFSYEKILTPSAFIQEVMPIIMAMPKGRDTVVYEEGTKDQVRLIDYIFKIFGEAEQETQAGDIRRKETQFSQKYTRKPYTEDLTDTGNTADEILKLLKNRVGAARRELAYVKSQYKTAVENDLPTFLRASSHDFIASTRFLSLSQMLPDPDDVYKIEEIYDRYKAEIQEACRPISDAQSNAIWGGPGTDSEKGERATQLLKDHTAGQIQKIEAAIVTFEREMNDFLATLKSPEGEGPLHERLMRQWKLL
jgi:hypothetical protein